MEEEQAAGAEPQEDSSMPESFSRLWTDVMGILVSDWFGWIGRSGEGARKLPSLGCKTGGFDIS